MADTQIFYNNSHALVAAAPTIASTHPLKFHKKLPGYHPTPLHSVSHLANKLGVGQVWVKDEAARLGLPSFKILGTSWATYRALEKLTGKSLANWNSLEELAKELAFLKPLTLVAATDGNHGRALARMAALLGFAACIYVPEDMTAERQAAIRSEGAEVVRVAGSYDDAVAHSAQEANQHTNYLVISDTAWPGYEEIPRWVVEGYSTIYWEVTEQLRVMGEAEPDVVVVQMGVGALAASVVNYYQAWKAGGLAQPPRIIGVEPNGAACVLKSLEHKRLVEVPGPHLSIMAGLNCGIPSLVAWPLLEKGLSLAVGIDDEFAREAMRELATAGIAAGESGAAGLGGLLALAASKEWEAVVKQLELNSESRILILNTEGITDHKSYQEITGKQ